jgi:hypothetical protein
MKSRLNPKKSSRSTLEILQDKRILDRAKVGLRHVVKPDRSVQHLGLNIGHPPGNRHMPNFYPGAAQTYSTVVRYNDQRAELTATLGRPGYKGHILDVSAHFPLNPLATELLRAASSPASCDNEVYGDAILVTDNRMHWVYQPYNVQPNEVLDLEEQLSTPRTLFDRQSRPWIFFHEEPNERDLVLLKMHFI